MRRRGQPTSLQERLTIQTLAQAGQSDPVIAATLGCRVATVRKWRRIAQQQGRVGLTSSMGRPASGALGTLTADQRAVIRHLRQQHPGWGPVTLLVELGRDPAWGLHPLPSRARLAAFLRQEGLSRRNQKRRALAQPAPTEASAAHDEWQLDAQGATQVAGVGKVCIINVADVVSRLKVESYPALATTQPTTDDYQLVLRRAFSTFGLPDHITLDHGCAFYDNTCASPYPTRLHLWLIALGVGVVFTRKRCPTDHALIERTHQTMTAQALTGQTWADGPALWVGLDDRRAQLNGVIPSAVLGGLAPLQADPTAAHSGVPYRVEWEAELLDLRRIDAYLADGQWFRTSNSHGEVWLGRQRYTLGTAWRNCEVELRYDAQRREVISQPAGTLQTYRFAVRGLTGAELMGELDPLVRLPNYQLALPFSRAAWRQLELAHSLG
jgi:transposase